MVKTGKKVGNELQAKRVTHENTIITTKTNFDSPHLNNGLSTCLILLAIQQLVVRSITRQKLGNQKEITRSRHTRYVKLVTMQVFDAEF